MINAIEEVPYADFVRPAGAVTPIGKDIGNTDEDKDKNKEEETKLQNDPLAKPPRIVKPKPNKADKPVVSNKPEKKTESTINKPVPIKPAPTRPAPAKPTPTKPQKKN